MTWTYNVRTKEFHLNGELKFKSQYAGAVGYKNDPGFECIKNKGPLPRGSYRIGAPYDSKKTGPYTLVLIPQSANNMCGRGDFRIHGDSKKEPGSASEGCIVAEKDFREKIWESGDRELIVK
ncbi:tlde1 domain-containing protein [Pantoea sp. BAV 3049]|uniref:tlde1 domain-containing protein n=1 Tax=Pantoea sp. BAV 3049 TaxID=2654188 RepID=UPI00131BE404|nr:tlde1 domain-containing protein [Pantoea sp. BAV 3049]